MFLPELTLPFNFIFVTFSKVYPMPLATCYVEGLPLGEGDEASLRLLTFHDGWRRSESPPHVLAHLLATHASTLNEVDIVVDTAACSPAAQLARCRKLRRLHCSVMEDKDTELLLGCGGLQELQLTVSDSATRLTVPVAFLRRAVDLRGFAVTFHSRHEGFGPQTLADVACALAASGRSALYYLHFESRWAEARSDLDVQDRQDADWERLSGALRGLPLLTRLKIPAPPLAFLRALSPAAPRLCMLRLSPPLGLACPRRLTSRRTADAPCVAFRDVDKYVGEVRCALHSYSTRALHVDGFRLLGCGLDGCDCWTSFGLPAGLTSKTIIGFHSHPAQSRCHHCATAGRDGSEPHKWVSLARDEFGLRFK